MHHPPHAAVVAQGQQLLPASVPGERRNMEKIKSKGNRYKFDSVLPGVPAAEGGGGLVREHDVVLGVVEHGLGLVLLLARRARPRVGDQTPRRGQLPQLHQRVLA